MIMSVMFDDMAERGIRDVTLEVRESNASAISLYESLGFRSFGIRENYYSDNGENAKIMWRINNE